MKHKGILTGSLIVVLLAGVCAASVLVTKRATKTEEGQRITQTEPKREAEPNEPREAEPSAEEEQTQTASDQSDVPEEKAETKETVLPTFMYFVSETDADYQEAIKTFEALQKEYQGRVVFDLKNTTKEPELLENFSLIDGHTPALIMLNTSNDIQNIVFANHDLDALRAEIESAFLK